MNKILHLTFLDFDNRIRIRYPSSLNTIQYYWWIAMIALLMRVAMCVPMYCFEHHLAYDLVLVNNETFIFAEIGEELRDKQRKFERSH